MNWLSLTLAQLNAYIVADKPITEAREIQIQLIFSFFQILMLDYETCIICVKE